MESSTPKNESESETRPKTLASSLAAFDNLFLGIYRPIAEEISRDLLDETGRIRIGVSPDVPRDELWIVQGRLVVAKIVDIG